MIYYALATFVICSNAKTFFTNFLNINHGSTIGVSFDTLQNIPNQFAAHYIAGNSINTKDLLLFS